MPQQDPLPRRATLDTLSVKIGSWFEAHATGRGVIAIPVVIVVLTLIAGLKLALG